jgi:hypothetical protein
MITPKQMELIKIAVDAYEIKLTVEVEKLNVNEEIKDSDDVATVLSNLTIGSGKDDISLSQIYSVKDDVKDDVTVSTEACNICFLERNELADSNSFLQTNCPCEIRACFQCWGTFYSSKKINEFIPCPKCRQDIKGFLVSQGFKKIRLCSHCRLPGHYINACPSRLDEVA